jgi:glyoxylase-like metal-dependent hydrolase (beta-lactamase superfamily II)
MTWQQLTPSVFVWRDSCNVYALVGPKGTVVINAGTGRWLDALDQLPRPPAALLCTHYFRDHSAGAARAARMGIPVYVPEGERAIFADPAEHFRQRDTYIIYDNYWDLFAPIEPIPPAGVLRDYERLALAGLDLEIIPLPGVTVTQIGVAVAQPGGPLIFCGEAIHSPGRVARVAPFQYNYNDLGGALACYASASDLRALRPSGLLPSLGTPMLDGAEACERALALLQENLTLLCAGRPEEAAGIRELEKEPLERVTEHVWKTTQAVAINWFVISESGKALVIDYGYHSARGLLAAGYSKPYRRRALLHSLEALKRHTGIDRIDVALISHFHDDHVCGVPLLQRLYGTECWAAEPFADLLAEPDSHCFPCDWPQPIQIDRRIALTETVTWEEYTFHFGAMNGHTRFSALIGFEADGRRFAHTGDQYFFLDAQGNWTDDLARWDDKQIAQNHVYRNGALLDGYARSAAWLSTWRPDVILTGHQMPMYTNADFFMLINRWASEYAELHQQVMALGADEPHFNLDSWGGWIWPYRTHIPSPRPIEVLVTLRNPLPSKATLEARLVGPQGWEGSAVAVQAEARAEVRVRLTITPTGPCRRQPFAVDLTANGQPYGQVAEALLTVGGQAF